MAQARSDRRWLPKLDAARRRLCIATRTAQPVGAMIRFVVDGEGAVVPDLERKLPGRGAWVTARHTLVAEAARRGAFARSLKAKVAAPADLPGVVEVLLERSALDALSRARRAGLVAVDLADAPAALADGRAIALLHPRDGGGAERGLEGPAGPRGVDRAETIAAFTTAQLDLALGRPNVVNAALVTGRASETFLERWRVVESFRADKSDLSERTSPMGRACGRMTVL